MLSCCLRFRSASCRLLLLLLVAAWCGSMAAQDTARVPVDTVSPAPRASQSMRHQRNAVVLRTGTSPDAIIRVVNAAGDTIALAPSATEADSLALLTAVEVLLPPADAAPVADTFNPDPKRALWLSALFPGLGQIYNRRYWKLPIVVGAFVGLSYGTIWNNRMYTDYSRAYRDITDSDPDTRSYMDFYPPNTDEASLNKDWLTNALKNKRDYYRRYRDICIFSMVGVYALCIIDAYVDASLAHFDITPDLSLNVKPAVLDPGSCLRLPALGVQCAVSF